MQGTRFMLPGRLSRDRSGNVTVMLAGGLMMLIATAGLAVDAGTFFLAKRRLPLPSLLARLVTRRAGKLAGVAIHRPRPLVVEIGVGGERRGGRDHVGPCAGDAERGRQREKNPVERH